VLYLHSEETTYRTFLYAVICFLNFSVYCRAGYSAKTRS